MHQTSFLDLELNRSRKVSCLSFKLKKINNFVDWEAILKTKEFESLIKLVSKKGAPHHNSINQSQDAFFKIAL